MGNGLERSLRALLLLAGVMLLLIGYYWVHKPLGVGLLQAWGGALLDLLAAGLLVTVSGGLGRRLTLRLAGHEILTRAELVALDAGLGLGGLALAALAAGMIGLLQPALLWALLLAAGVVALPGLRLWLADCLHLARTTRPATPWQLFLALFSGALLALALLHALSPPFAWDALMYHLVGPGRYLSEGVIRAQADNHYLGFPQVVEMLFTLSMGITGRDTAAAPVHFAYGLLLLLAAGGMTRRYADRTAGWMSAALLLSSYSLWLLFGWPYVDLAVMAYALLALVAADRWRETGGAGWLALAGGLTGLLVGVKYTGGLMAVALAVYVIITMPRRALINGPLLAGAALLVFAPWLLKGLLLYHNPIYPFVFGGLNWDTVRAGTFGVGGGLLHSGDAWQLVALPLAATIFGVEKGPGYSFTLGPWLLTAPLLLIVGWGWLDARARALARGLLLLLALLLALWMPLAALSSIGMGPRQTAGSLLALSAVAGALGFHALSRAPRQPFDLYFIVRGILAFTLALALIDGVQATLRHQVPDYMMGRIDRDNFLGRELGMYQRAMQRLGELPSGSQVALLWESRAYYCPPHITCAADPLTDAWSRLIRLGHTPDEVMAAWRGAGIDYLLVWELGFEFLTQDDPRSAAAQANRLFPAAVEAWLAPVWSDGFAYTLYGWRSPP